MSRPARALVRLTSLLFLAELPAARVWAQEQLATIVGRVQTASGVAIELVEVTVLEGSRTAVSASNGTFRITRVPLGGVMLRARRMGFGVVTVSAQIDSAGDRRVILEMSPLPQMLDPVLIRDRSGFQNEAMWKAYASRARFRQSEPNSFASREVLERYGSQPLSRVLPHLNARFLTRDADKRYAERKYEIGTPLNVQIATKMNEAVKDPPGPKICVVENGVANAGATTLDDYAANRIEAVEMYPPGSRLPSDLGQLAPTGERGCNGMVVVWLKY
ncbi:MAG: carboxypeptidase regulatory-like domain-containing protein [Gemmatimonadetes bacterium]|nr:carboxypeptidase regulatory-like domain-containing protein [Gemmatimonadota bacterium]